jgi:hypothetical protein
MEIEDGPDVTPDRPKETRVITSPRFVLLRHEMPAGPGKSPSTEKQKFAQSEVESPMHASAAESHWDLMFERPAGLLTFRLAALPEYRPIGPLQFVAAQRIADHRPLYLDYEGEVAGNRGRVWRVADGIYASHRVKRRTKISLVRERQLASIWLDDCEVGESIHLEVLDWSILASGSPK